MKPFYKFHSFAFILFFYASQGAASEPTPTQVYEQYIDSVQSMTSMKTRPFEKYISTRAKEFVKQKIGKLKDSQYDAFLAFWKQEASALPEDGVSVKNEQASAILSFTLNNYPEKGSTLKTQIIFIKEEIWKIDKIIRETKGTDFSFKSTTF